MKSFLLFSSLLLGATVQAEEWQPEAGFTSLFNGKDLSGWCHRAKVDKNAPTVGNVTENFDGKAQSSDPGYYSVKDGVLLVNFPNEKDKITGQLYTVEEFPNNFVLKLMLFASRNICSSAYYDFFIF